MASSRAQATDEELMIRFQSGDRPAFALLVHRYKTTLYNFALRQVRHAPTAEEVVQDAFIRVVQSARDFRQSARFAPWVYTIVRNLCIDQIRRRALRQHASLDAAGAAGSELTLGERTGDANANVERAAVSVEIRERVIAAVEELPDEQREVFLMREVGNLAFKDIAAVVGIPENTVKSRMRYALERLQSALSEFEEYARALR